MRFTIHQLFFLMCIGTVSAQYITTDESRTPLQLIENVLINSGCASVSNVSVLGGNFNTAKVVTATLTATVLAFLLKKE